MPLGADVVILIAIRESGAEAMYCVHLSYPSTVYRVEQRASDISRALEELAYRAFTLSRYVMVRLPSGM